MGTHLIFTDHYDAIYTRDSSRRFQFATKIAACGLAGNYVGKLQGTKEAERFEQDDKSIKKWLEARKNEYQEKLISLKRAEKVRLERLEARQKKAEKIRIRDELFYLEKAEKIRMHKNSGVTTSWGGEHFTKCCPNCPFF